MKHFQNKMFRSHSIFWWFPSATKTQLEARGGICFTYMAGTCKCAKSARLRIYENMSYFHQSSIFIDLPLVFVYTLKPPNSAMPIVVGKQCFMEIGFEGKSLCDFNNFNASQNKKKNGIKLPIAVGRFWWILNFQKCASRPGFAFCSYRSRDGFRLNCALRTTTFWK